MPGLADRYDGGGFVGGDLCQVGGQGGEFHINCAFDVAVGEFFRRADIQNEGRVFYQFGIECIGGDGVEAFGQFA